MASINIDQKIVKVKLKTNELEKEVSTNRFSPTRPEVLDCDVHVIKVSGVPHIVLVGKIDDRPYEVFVTPEPEDEKLILEKDTRTYLKKVRKNRYDLVVENGSVKIAIQDISKKFDDQYGTLSRFISMSLRHEVPLPFIVEQLSKDQNFLGFERAAARVLKKYIKEGDPAPSGTCPECGSTNLVYQSGCKMCADCGNSKCD